MPTTSRVLLGQHEAEYGLGEDKCRRLCSRCRHQIPNLGVASGLGGALAAFENPRLHLLDLVQVANRILDNLVDAKARQPVQRRIEVLSPGDLGNDFADRLRLQRGHQLHIDEPLFCGAIRNLADERARIDRVTEQAKCSEELVVTCESGVSDEASHGPCIDDFSIEIRVPQGARNRSETAIGIAWRRRSRELVEVYAGTLVGARSDQVLGVSASGQMVMQVASLWHRVKKRA